MRVIYKFLLERMSVTKGRNNMGNLFIIKKITENKKLSDMAFTVWCGLRNIMVKDVKEYFISYNFIGYSLFGRVPVRNELDAIKKGFKELLELKCIKIVEKYSNNEFVVDLSALYYEQGQGYFSNLTDVEMRKILNLNCKQDKYKLLRYFTCQVGTFNQSLEGIYKGKIGGMSLDSFVDMLGYSKVSIIAYNEVLLKAHILFVHTHGDFYQSYDWKGQSKVREMPNTYSRYEDRFIAMDYMKQYQGWKFQNSWEKNADANWRRGMAQKLRHFQNGKEYDIETIKELYIYVDEKNRYMKIEYDNNIAKGFKAVEPEYIDVGIFDDYLLEIGEA